MPSISSHTLFNAFLQGPPVTSSMSSTIAVCRGPCIAGANVNACVANRSRLPRCNSQAPASA
eukprot:3277-Heterococcus_DN1.PRE.2